MAVLHILSLSMMLSLYKMLQTSYFFCFETLNIGTSGFILNLLCKMWDAFPDIMDAVPLF